jgi:hypothetical protein
MADVDKIVKLLATTDGRDKLYKFSANMAKIIAFSSADKTTQKKWNGLAKSIGEGRSLMRMGKWVGNVSKLQGFGAKLGSLSQRNLVEVLRVIGDFGYVLGDNLAYLSKYNILPLDAKQCGKNSKVFQFWGYLCALILDLWSLMLLPTKNLDAATSKKERTALVLSATKNLADTLSALNNVGYASSFGYNPSVGFTGACGATSGAIATYTNWKKIK